MNFLKSFWKAITVVRNGLANFLFIVIIVVIVVALLAPREAPLPDSAPLLLSPSGVLVDHSSIEPSLTDLFADAPRDRETVLRDLTLMIRHARDDKRITGLVMNLNHLDGANLSKLEEIGEAITAFKSSGKPVIAYADNFSQAQYFLASFADTIYLNPLGGVGITGFGYFGSYFKEAADKLSVKFHLFKVGDYKDAAEPFVRNDMSQASREHNSLWIKALWQRYTSGIEARRAFDQGAIDTFLNNIAATLSQGNVDFAKLSVDMGLVDELLSRNALNAKLIEQFGEDEESGYFKAIPQQRYLHNLRPLMPPSDDAIGLIVARGTIVDGYGDSDQIGGDALSQLIRQASEDESLAALILRIDSGGGSAFASEVIREALVGARANGLPVYVSMSSVAASGGYWIATAADEIWAQPATITGSIGVWGLVPNFSEAMPRLGVHSDGIGTTPLADLYELDRPLSPEAKLVFQNGVNDIYAKFIQLVASARGKSPEEIHAIAQGRVWTGEKALELGLVDTLGSLDALAQAVAEKHSLPGVNIKLVEPPLSPSEALLRALMEQSHSLGGEVKRALLGEGLSRLAERVEEPLGELVNGARQGLKVFAQCLGCVAP